MHHEAHRAAAGNNPSHITEPKCVPPQANIDERSRPAGDAHTARKFPLAIAEPLCDIGVYRE
ncbi:MAG: hypothetical protein D6753_12370 [Planctomycetota bacterium]|nr:MAG: hypothetical protein D6753_12370 [Planctomycetota bacterium]